jgi:hypothetical protein
MGVPPCEEGEVRGLTLGGAVLDGPGFTQLVTRGAWVKYPCLGIG